MATLEIKYSIGDTVYHAGSYVSEQSAECPDCLGSLKWVVRFATGEEAECACKTCDKGWSGASGRITWNEHQPKVMIYTIGQVGFEDGRGRYMCEETGIGSGSIYCDDTLFSTHAEAEGAANKICDAQMKSVAKNNFKRKYEFADKLGTFGYSRKKALEENRKMRRWIELIKEA